MTCDHHCSPSVNYLNNASKKDQIEQNWWILWLN